eukprot:m.150032 g.150032  ORF g.150032 m.150032 type:complete len:1175 (-) comp13277_c0_seq3:247-3771(-)
MPSSMDGSPEKFKILSKVSTLFSSTTTPILFSPEESFHSMPASTTPNERKSYHDADTPATCCLPRHTRGNLPAVSKDSKRYYVKKNHQHESSEKHITHVYVSLDSLSASTRACVIAFLYVHFPRNNHPLTAKLHTCRLDGHYSNPFSTNEDSEREDSNEAGLEKHEKRARNDHDTTSTFSHADFRTISLQQEAHSNDHTSMLYIKAVLQHRCSREDLFESLKSIKIKDLVDSLDRHVPREFYSQWVGTSASHDQDANETLGDVINIAESNSDVAHASSLASPGFFLVHNTKGRYLKSFGVDPLCHINPPRPIHQLASSPCVRTTTHTVTLSVKKENQATTTTQVTEGGAGNLHGGSHATGESNHVGIQSENTTLHIDEQANLSTIALLPYACGSLGILYSLLLAMHWQGIVVSGLRLVYFPLSSQRQVSTMPVLINVHPLQHLRETFDLPAPHGGDIPLLVCQLVGKDVCPRVSALIGPVDFHVAKQTDPTSFHAHFASHRHHVLVCTRAHATSLVAYNDATRWFGKRTPSLDAFQEHSSVSSLLYTPCVTRCALRVPSSVGLPVYFKLLRLLSSLGIQCESHKLVSIPTSTKVPHDLAPSKGKFSSTATLTSYFLFMISLVGKVSSARSVLTSHCNHIISSCGMESSLTSTTSVHIDPLEGPHCKISQACVDLITSASLKVPLRHPQLGSAAFDFLLASSTIGQDELPEIAVITMQSCNSLHLNIMLERALQACRVKGSVYLVGCKLLSQLTAFQAKQLTTIEVGLPGWRKSVTEYTSHPLFAAVIAGVGVLGKLQRFVSNSKDVLGKGVLDMCSDCIECSIATHHLTCSFSRKSALSQACALFSDRELLVPEPLFLPHLPLPSTWHEPSIYAPIPSCLIVGKDGISHLPHLIHQLYLGGFEVTTGGFQEKLVVASTSHGATKIPRTLSKLLEASDDCVVVLHLKRCNAIQALARRVGTQFDASTQFPSHYLFAPTTLDELGWVTRTMLDDLRPEKEKLVETINLDRDPSKSSLLEVMTIVVPYVSPANSNDNGNHLQALLPGRVLGLLQRKGYQLVGFRAGSSEALFVKSLLPESVNAFLSGPVQPSASKNMSIRFETNEQSASSHFQVNKVVVFAVQRLNGITCSSTLVPELQEWALGIKCWYTSSTRLEVPVLRSCFQYLSPDSVVSVQS